MNEGLVFAQFGLLATLSRNRNISISTHCFTLNNFRNLSQQTTYERFY
jgi:hypothetical protein